MSLSEKSWSVDSHGDSNHSENAEEGLVARHCPAIAHDEACSPPRTRAPSPRARRGAPGTGAGSRCRGCAKSANHEGGNLGFELASSAHGTGVLTSHDGADPSATTSTVEFAFAPPGRKAISRDSARSIPADDDGFIFAAAAAGSVDDDSESTSDDDGGVSLNFPGDKSGGDRPTLAVAAGDDGRGGKDRSSPSNDETKPPCTEKGQSSAGKDSNLAPPNSAFGAPLDRPRKDETKPACTEKGQSSSASAGKDSNLAPPNIAVGAPLDKPRKDDETKPACTEKGQSSPASAGKDSNPTPPNNAVGTPLDKPRKDDGIKPTCTEKGQSSSASAGNDSNLAPPNNAFGTPLDRPRKEDKTKPTCTEKGQSSSASARNDSNIAPPNNAFDTPLGKPRKDDETKPACTEKGQSSPASAGKDSNPTLPNNAVGTPLGKPRKDDGIKLKCTEKGQSSSASAGNDSNIAPPNNAFDTPLDKPRKDDETKPACTEKGQSSSASASNDSNTSPNNAFDTPLDKPRKDDETKPTCTEKGQSPSASAGKDSNLTPPNNAVGTPLDKPRKDDGIKPTCTEKGQSSSASAGKDSNLAPPSNSVGTPLDKPRSNDSAQASPHSTVINGMHNSTNIPDGFTPIHDTGNSKPTPNLEDPSTPNYTEGPTSDSGADASPHGSVASIANTDQPSSNRAVVPTLPDMDKQGSSSSEFAKALYTYLANGVMKKRLKPRRSRGIPQPNPPPESGMCSPIEATPGPAPLEIPSLGSSTASPKSCASQDSAPSDRTAFRVYRRFARHCPEFKMAVSNRDLLQLLDSHRALSKRIDEASTAYRTLERDHSLQGAVLQECVSELERASPVGKELYDDACKRAVRRLEDELDNPPQTADSVSPPTVQVYAWIEAVLGERGLDFGPPRPPRSPDKGVADLAPGPASEKARAKNPRHPGSLLTAPAAQSRQTGPQDLRAKILAQVAGERTSRPTVVVKTRADHECRKIAGVQMELYKRPLSPVVRHLGSVAENERVPGLASTPLTQCERDMRAWSNSDFGTVYGIDESTLTWHVEEAAERFYNFSMGLPEPKRRGV